MPQSNRLILDVPQINDFERFYEINSDPETNLFNPSGPMNLEKAKETFGKMVAIGMNIILAPGQSNLKRQKQ